jgi:hypothetical protein
MDWLQITLALYGTAFRRAGALTFANWPVLATLFVYAAIMTASLALAGMLGILGGFVVSLVWAACLGSFLALVEIIVRAGRVGLEDFRRSFGAYLWDVAGVLFILWIVRLVVVPALATLTQGVALLILLNLAVFVFFNAVPELIYLGHYSSLDLLGESYRFISENWIEWFPPNLAMALVLWVVADVPVQGAAQWLHLAVLALLVYYCMVVRGLLFQELHGSSRRSRAFRWRAGR